MRWQITSVLPEGEPDDAGLEAYAAPQLIAGATEDGRFVFDAVYAAEWQQFVLTLMEVNGEWGFVEKEKRLYPQSRRELLAAVADFQAAPEAVLSDGI